jgi:hypothetical protein
MPAVVDLSSLIGSLLPHVRDPWPESIGLGFPFTTSGAASMLAGVVFAEASQARRDRLVSRFGVFGFWGGVLLYAVALLAQLGYAP